MPRRIPEPWLGFLRDVDRGLTRPVDVHCLGGFVLVVLCGLPRPTVDVDFVELESVNRSDELLRIAGEGSDIARAHRLHFQRVTVADCPAEYASRLVDLTPRSFKRLRLRAFEVHDVVLAKLGRNSARDRADVEFLVGKDLLKRRVLERRFESELRPYAFNEKRSTDAFRLWLDLFFQ
jgi:hypothetical protein